MRCNVQIPNSFKMDAKEVDTSEAHELAQKIVTMATNLGIDPASEFHLLPIAKHAVDAPDEWTGGDGESDPRLEDHADLEWFKKLVETERERYNRNPVDASPWLKLADSDGTGFYYNFKTRKSTSTLPGYRPAASLEPPNMEEADLEVMRFISWWTERGAKKFLKINYYMRTEEFEVDIENDDKLYRMKTLKGKFGPASCWDLHLKATLNIFGRKMTLQQCDHDTRKWIEANATRLLKVKKKLEETLMKYEKVPESRSGSVLVEMHLRAIMNTMTRLKAKLAAHRPALAAKFQI